MSQITESGYHIGVVGVTGMVGREFIRILDEDRHQNFPVASVRGFSSEGRRRTFNVRGVEYPVEKGEPKPEIFEGLDFVLTAVGDEQSKLYCPAIATSGGLVIDKSNAFRMDPRVPLVVPEVNPQDAKDHQGIIAGPNCSTIQMVVVLSPIHRVNPIKRIIVDTYQAISGSGDKGIEELEMQMEMDEKGQEPLPIIYPRPIVHNVIPQIGKAIPWSRYSYQEEVKMRDETRKILHEPELPVDATCVRVDVRNGHSEAVHIELTDPMSVSDAADILSKANGVALSGSEDYDTPYEVSGMNDVFVGRLRPNSFSPRGLSMWIVSDNIRKGAALNAYQVFELVARNDWIKPQSS